jgi:hypothetical protein
MQILHPLSQDGRSVATAANSPRTRADATQFVTRKPAGETGKSLLKSTPTLSVREGRGSRPRVMDCP